jgi:hypothetical protein
MRLLPPVDLTKLGFDSALITSNSGDDSNSGDTMVGSRFLLESGLIDALGRGESDDSGQVVTRLKQKCATFVRKVTIRRVFSQFFQNERSWHVSA